MNRPSVATALAAVSSILALAGCGLPTGGNPQRLDSDRVPYNLLGAPAHGPGASEPPDAPGPRPRLYWVDDDALVAVQAPADCQDDELESSRRLLAELVAGPSESARADGLTSALPPDLELRIAGIEGRTATVEVKAETPGAADRLPVVIGQIVLTLTSIASVDAVEFVNQAGDTVEVPVPDGALTSQPVGAASYDELIRAEAQPGPSAAPPRCD